LEDALKKGILSLERLSAFANEKMKDYPNNFPRKCTQEVFNKLAGFQKEAEGAIIFAEKERDGKKVKEGTEKDAKTERDIYAIRRWIPYLQEWLMFVVIWRFDKSYKEIMAGEYLQDLFYDTNHEYTVEIIDSVMKEFVFPYREILKLELAADEILTGLLEKFVPAVLYRDKIYAGEGFVEFQKYQKLYQLISPNYRIRYEKELADFCASNPWEESAVMDVYLRLLLAVDYISGMTDSYAKALYQELTGIY
jgi:dGTPase